MNLQDLGDRIRERRKKRGLTQTDVANAVRVSPQAVSKWERGENAPDISALPALAQLLGASVEWLLGCQSADTDVIEATAVDLRARYARAKSEKLPPRDFADWTNSICFQITEAVLRFGGIPIKNRGAGLLCFFSGNGHAQRGLEAALHAARISSEALKIGISTGQIYFGSIGHPDYARPDIIGEAVGIALLNSEWADENTQSGIAIDTVTLKQISVPYPEPACTTEVDYYGISHTVEIAELPLPE